MPRTTPWGSVGSSPDPGASGAGCEGPSARVHVAFSARGVALNVLTPGPSRCVARSVWSAAQASAHGLRGQGAVATRPRSIVRSSTSSSSCAHATNTSESSALTSTPIGSEHTVAEALTEPEATSTA